MDIKKVGEEIKSRVSPPVIMLVVAIFIAGIISYWIYGFLKEKSEIKTVAMTNTQQVTVAAFDMTWGTVINKELVKTTPYVKESLPTGYIATPSSIIGRVVIFPIKTNEPITESKLAPVNITTGGLAAVLTPKKRAMAVKVDKVVGVSGFIKPGHRVDVLVTLSPLEGEGVQKNITKIVLENILVLAAGAQIDQQGASKEESAAVDVITLEVTPDEGEKLALAASKGQLQLALRNYADTEDVLTRGATLPKLLDSYVGSGATSSAAVVKGKQTGYKKSYASKTSPKVFTVELIMGTKTSQEKFVREGE
jgi:pilus assembly protein CpaB